MAGDIPPILRSNSGPLAIQWGRTPPSIPTIRRAYSKVCDELVSTDLVSRIPKQWHLLLRKYKMGAWHEDAPEWMLEAFYRAGVSAPLPISIKKPKLKKGKCVRHQDEVKADDNVEDAGQGCKFTSAEWTDRLLDLGVAISLDGRGRWMANVFIERLWRRLKHEEIYLFEHGIVHALRAGVRKWFGRYNDWRPHEAPGNLPPAVVYQTASRAPKSGRLPRPVPKPLDPADERKSAKPVRSDRPPFCRSSPSVFLGYAAGLYGNPLPHHRGVKRLIQ